MAVKSDTASTKQADSPVGKKIAVQYVSDEDSAAQAREAAIKNDPKYKKAVQERHNNTLLSQDLIDRAQRHKKRPLTTREIGLIKGIVAGKTKRQAAKDAGYGGSDSTVSVTASQVLKKPNVKEAMQAALAEAGVTIASVAEVVADGLKANRLVIVGNGEDSMADLQPDHSIRLRAASMAGKYLGAEDSDKPEGGSGNTFNFNFNNPNFDSKKYVRDGSNVIDGEVVNE